MEKYKTLYLTNRHTWRQWLEENFDKEKDVWLVFPRKSTGKPRISYNDAVEEALCFGWIDSQVKTLDEGHTMQRFTPRNPKSAYSQPNKERLQWLAEQKMIHPAVEERVKEVLNEAFVFPADILEALKKDPIVWEHYEKFSESYKRIRIAYIDAARKRPEAFTKRLTNFMEKTRNNKLIPGHGGIDKYYCSYTR